MADTTPDPTDWTRNKASHLLFRAGFGGKPGEIDDFAKRGLSASLDALLSGPTRELPVPAWLEEDKKLDPRQLRMMSKEEKQKLQMIARQHMREMVGGWVKFMMDAPTPADMLHERMVFFWHGHFATSVQKVQATPFVYNQLKLFHDKSLGNFGDLLHAIVRDPAMLRYLDNDQNRKGKPNENLARELMELFSLGVGNYTEDDIREGARALTGWGIEPYQFVFRPRAHDDGEKTIFGKKGNFDGDQFTNLILEQPACAEFMARKLWVYFASENPKKEVIHELASKFRESKYDIKTLLRAVFSHPEFYSPEVIGSQIKSPIQLVVGTARTLGLTASKLELYGRMLLMMGQVPYAPPNVKGWPGGRTWIDTSRLVTRYTFAEIIAKGRIPSEIDPRQQGDAELVQNEMPAEMDRETKTEEPREQRKQLSKGQRKTMLPRNLRVDFDASKLAGAQLSVEETVDKITRLLLPVAPSEGERKNLVKTLEKNLADSPREEALQILVGQIMLLPAYQLC